MPRSSGEGGPIGGGLCERASYIIAKYPLSHGFHGVRRGCFEKQRYEFFLIRQFFFDGEGGSANWAN